MPLPRLSRRGIRTARWVASAIVLGAIFVGRGAFAVGSTPSYPTISGPSTGTGGVAVAVTVGDFTLADASASGSNCGISSFRATMITDLGTINMSSSGGATVTGNRSTTITVTGSRAQVEAALDSASVTASAAGTATVTTTFRPADAFTASSTNYVFSTTTGHYYRRFDNGRAATSSNVRTALDAAAPTFCGAPGYAGTITSANELSDLATWGSTYGTTTMWLSGIRSSDASAPLSAACVTDADPSCSWYWVPGENAPAGEQNLSFPYGNSQNPPGASPWATDEPDDDGAYLSAAFGAGAITWDDRTDVATEQYALLEFGNNASYTVTSTTTTLTLTRPACATATTYSGNLAYFTATGAGCTGTWTRPNADITVITLFVVGGGGGGGYRGGGGGSGGGVLGLGYPTSNYSVSGSSYTITVGGGGAGATVLDATGASGTTSTFGSLTALGGAGGGSRDNAGANGPSGGGGGSSTSARSGGAASYATDTGNPSSTGAGVSSTSTYGLVGAANNTAYPLQGGGGGGAFGSAATSPNSAGALGQPGTGGAGYGISGFATGIPLIPYSPTSTVATWASGGGGGRDDGTSMTGSNSNSGSNAGGGGGGNRAGQNAYANSGNGGGGGGYATNGYGNGGNGAAGMVFIRYDVTPAWRTGSTAYDGQTPDAYTTTNTVNDLAFGRVGTAYSQFAFVQKGVGESVDDWNYSTSGSLPPGITLSEVGLRKVELSGTPTTPGVYTFSLSASDGSTGTTDATYSFRIAITGLTQSSLAFAWPLASSITIPGPSNVSGGWYAGVCLYASDASGAASGSLRFDVGTKGTQQATIASGSGTITVTNDYAYGSMFLAGATASDVLALLNQPDAITITRANFRSTFYFTVRYVPYFPGASVTCSTGVGTTGVQQVVEVRSLGASFTGEYTTSLG